MCTVLSVRHGKDRRIRGLFATPRQDALRPLARQGGVGKEMHVCTICCHTLANGNPVVQRPNFIVDSLHLPMIRTFKFADPLSSLVLEGPATVCCAIPAMAVRCQAAACGASTC